MENQTARGKRIIVAISGASGAVYGVRILELLRDDPAIEVHLVVSEAAEITIHYELDRKVEDILALADVVYKPHEIGASIASGSFEISSMIVAPCSIKTLSSIANSYTDNLISRAADVQLKERRPLVLMVRETPLHLGHLRLMTLAAETGAIIMPPVPAFYTKPGALQDIVDESVYRALRLLGVKSQAQFQWKGNN